MKRIMIAVSAIACYLFIVVGINFSHSAHPVATLGSEVASQLLEYSEAHCQEPQEPRLDPVWRFVPGLKGVEVDYGLTYENINAAGAFDRSLVVKRSIPYIGDPQKFRHEPVFKGNEHGDYVSLLINVAWGEQELNQMIEILDRLDVKANFFFEGKYAENHSYQVAKVYNQGHVVGNHSYSHPRNWDKLTYVGYADELARSNGILTAITGQPTLYFTPPAGQFNKDVLKAAYDQGLYTILWTADTLDWKGGQPQDLVGRVKEKLEPGALIRLHPKPLSVLALEPIIELLREEGYQFKTIHEIVYGSQQDCINN
ncbi:MAG: polysaccharide deacetylase family protein [Turicibacter sp.]|nr:polysaccharide deacetylase family protein [Turicibacter sp.]